MCSLSPGNTEKAREILKNIDSVAPGFVSIRQARIGLEFRQRRYSQVEELYRSFLEDSSLTSEARNFYSWRYSKFAARVCESCVCSECVKRDREREGGGGLHTSIDHGALVLMVCCGGHVC